MKNRVKLLININNVACCVRFIEYLLKMLCNLLKYNDNSLLGVRATQEGILLSNINYLTSTHSKGI
jgi:hypothetical protein